MTKLEKDFASTYFMQTDNNQCETHILSVIVDNEPGVLARVIGLFSARGYNIESLSVSETEHEKHFSRITIVTRAQPATLDQIRHQLARIIPVREVIDLTQKAMVENKKGPVERELALVKIDIAQDQRAAILALIKSFQAHIIDESPTQIIVEVTGTSMVVDQFLDAILPLGLAEICRTGVCAL